MSPNIFAKLFRRRRRESREAPTREDFMKLIPVRNPIVEWGEYADGGVYIVVRKGGGVKKEKRLNLDDIGSFIWLNMDGRNSVEDILSRICSKYKLAKVEAETPLLLFLRRLAERKLIAFLPREAISIGEKRRGRRSSSEG
ncbi:MAG: PqqD family protein [Candidatus Bathyarchaeia archaeon]|nr:PqqD family protein [Candidatus Bathyarchaeota archaeon]